MRYEHLRVLVEDESVWLPFTSLAQAFANANLPDSIVGALRLGRVTALEKKDNNVRGIVAGAIIRRLVCKTVAQRFSDDFMRATAPFQLALQTRAGTDALAHLVQYLTDADEETVIASLDGVGAFDHVTRARFVDKWCTDKALSPPVPLTRMLRGSQSRLLWTDNAGTTRTILQGEGGEQGCPLMPALFALAQHDALVQADANLLSSERILRFLDDLYVITSKARAREAFEEVANRVKDRAGACTRLGKLHAWCKAGGEAPSDLAELGDGVWTADKPETLNGVVALGTHLGQPAVVRAHAQQRVDDEQHLLDKIVEFTDPQYGFALLMWSSVPRANHLVRILPTSESADYAQSHDDSIWDTFVKLAEAQMPQHASFPLCPAALVDSACVQHSAVRLELTGLLGPTLCQFCTPKLLTPKPTSSQS